MCYLYYYRTHETRCHLFLRFDSRGARVLRVRVILIPTTVVSCKQTHSYTSMQCYLWLLDNTVIPTNAMDEYVHVFRVVHLVVHFDHSAHTILHTVHGGRRVQNLRAETYPSVWSTRSKLGLELRRLKLSKKFRVVNITWIMISWEVWSVLCGTPEFCIIFCNCDVWFFEGKARVSA